jgi:hypothetical protein
MADFAITVTAAEPALGWKPGSFLDIYSDTCRVAVEGLFEGDVVVAALQKLSLPWSGTAGELRRHLVNLVMPNEVEHLPKTAKAMGEKMRNLGSGLRQTGIDVTRHKGHKPTIEIRRVSGAHAEGDGQPNDAEPGGLLA